MDRILRHRSEIYGFLILWIVVFHIERVVGMVIYLPLLTPFIRSGNCGVDAFMFLSGYCICLSLKRDFNVNHFYVKRFIRVVIPYLIIAIPFLLWKSIEEFSSLRVFHFFFDLSGLSFWLSGCQNAWFVHAIIVFYCITPFLFLIVRRSYKGSFLFLICLYVLFFLAYYYLPIFHFSAIAFARLPIFFFGLICAYRGYFDYLHDRRIKYIFLFLLCVIFFLLFPSYINRFYRFLLYGFTVVPLLFFFAIVIESMPMTIQFVLSSLGNYSLELYLSHIMILHILRFYKVEQSIGLWMYLLLPILALLTSLGVTYISNMINRNQIK